MSKIKQYAEDTMGEEGFEKYLDEETEASHDGEE